jgi:maltokinase
VTSDGLVTASYAADEALLGELRAAWPPGPSPLRTASDRGYVSFDLAAHPPAAAVRLGDRFAVALIPDGDAWRSIPLAGFGGRWWQAAPGDGLSAFVAGVPAASERAPGVDQTNDSVVVGERVVVKWFRRVGPAPSRAGQLLAHLDATGFAGIPRPLGAIAWRTADGTELALAQGDAWLAGARDGWDWAVERLQRGTPSAAATGRQLGELTAGLHAALATPTGVLPDPIDDAPPAGTRDWAAAAAATLNEALALTDGPDGDDLRRLAPSIRTALDAIGRDRPVRLQPVHGDFHVGQVLEWAGGLAVIDFDGNPALGSEANAIRQPVERDVAQLLSSLDHVGRIVERRRGDRPDRAVAEWILVSRDAFLAAYGPVDPDLLAAFEAEQELRELVYAARFLPRWRYAPLATLRARFGPPVTDVPRSAR